MRHFIEPSFFFKYRVETLEIKLRKLFFDRRNEKGRKKKKVTALGGVMCGNMFVCSRLEWRLSVFRFRRSGLVIGVIPPN